MTNPLQQQQVRRIFRLRASASQAPDNRAPMPGLRTTKVLLLLPVIALLAFASWTGALSAQTAAVPNYDHIFFVIDENHSRTQVIGPAPYLTGLANAGAQSTAYNAVSHPSLPNYLALTDGTTHGVTDDGTGYVFNGNTIAHAISGSGRSWKGYMEDLPAPCDNTSGSAGYAKKHDPFMYQSTILSVPSECNRVVPYTQLATDLGSASTTPNYVWITPNLCNDMHDCSVGTGDNWARANFPAIFNSPAWKTQHSLFVFTIDEGSGSNNVPFFALSSDGTTKTGFTSTVGATHYSWLRTIEAAWGLGQMSSSDAAASPMTDLFTGSAPASPSPSPSSSAPPTTGVLSGTVTNASGGRAIAGATVSDSGGTSTTTDGSGAYSLPGLTPGTHSVGASATGFNAGTKTASVTAGTTTSVNFSLTAAPPAPGSINGSVTSAADGTAISGARVSNTGGLTATTDGAGAYTLSGLTPGSHTLTATATGFSAQTQTASVTSGTTTMNVNFSLAPSATTQGVTGTVSSTVGGAVITGATVTDSGGGSATTDGSGVYNLPGLNPGSHTLTASVAGYTSVTQTTTVAAGTTQTVNFSLTPMPATGALTGSVTNASGGAAIAGATVTDSGGPSASTSASGAFTLSGLSAGSHTLTASATGFNPQTQSASVTAGNTTQNVSFSLTPTATGTPALVQESGATESSASSSLTATFASSTSPGHLLVLSTSVYTGISNRITSVTDSGGNSWTKTGAYAMTGHNSDGEMWYAASAAATTGVTVHMAKPGVASIAIQEFSGVAAVSPLTASTGASNTSTSPGTGSLSPTAAGDLVVGFIAGHANPQAISVTAAGYTAQRQQTSSSVGSTIASVVTGYKVLTSNSAEAYTGNFASYMYWAAGMAGFKAATISPPPPTGSITGTVTRAGDGAAISGATVSVTGGASGSTDASGTYSLTGLSPGNHTLTASAAGYTTTSQAVSVTAGGTQNLNFVLSPAPSTGAISGTVTDASTGAAIVGAMVRESGGAATSTDASGAYTLSGLASGGYTLTATATDYDPGTLTASVTVGNTTQDVSFGLWPSTTTGGVGGTLTSASGGLAIAGATVTDGGGATATSDASGVYTLTGLTPGMHTLVGSATGFTTSLTKSFSIIGGINGKVSFSLTPSPTTGAVNGTVTSASSGMGIAGATVTDSGGASVPTNGLGLYTLTGLAPGDHNLTASAGGFTAGTTTALVTSGQTTQNVGFILTPSASPAGGPIRATFLYDWYPETWNQGSHYMPNSGHYSSADPAILRAQVASMLYAHITTGINSWFGPGTVTDSRINLQLAADHGTAFTTSLYYEQEGYVDPSAAQIGSDMDYAARYFADPSYLHINGKPVVFVYANGADNCSMAQRWAQGTAGKNIYVVLKVFSGYLACADQPSSWHQYSGAVREDRQGKFSTTIAPSFWKWGEAAPRLSRDPVAFATAVRDMVASGAQWQLIVSFNEYVEGTQIEATTDMPNCAGQGVFLTILHRDGNPGPC